MVVDWPEVPLGDLVQNFDSRRVPLSSRVRLGRPGPYPYHGATGVMDYVDGYLFEGLHLLVGEDGSVETPAGTPFLQLVDGQFWVNNHAHVLRGATDEETRYLYYALSTVQIRPFMSGSVQAKLSQRNLNQIPIPYPTHESQRLAIADILGTLDDKIELNRRMNETLEAMARALFRSWFVDFEPVRAKVEGRWRPGESLPGLPAHLHPLFPDRLVESEMGEIPEGWSVSSVGEEVELPYGRALKSDDRKVGSIPVMGSNGTVGYHDTALATGPGIVVGRKGNPGFVRWVSTDFWPIDTTFYVRPRRELTLEYLYQALLGQDLASLAADSAVPGINRNFIYANTILVPPLDLVSTYSAVVEPLWRLSAQHEIGSESVKSIRDTLLPELLSGRVRTWDTERGSGLSSPRI